MKYRVSSIGWPATPTAVKVDVIGKVEKSTEAGCRRLHGCIRPMVVPRSSEDQPLSNDSKFTTEARRHGENQGVLSFLRKVRSV